VAGAATPCRRSSEAANAPNTRVVLVIGEAVLKFALVAGVVIEWVIGPAVESAVGFGFAALRALVAGLLAWMILEAVHLLVRAVLLLDDRA
jgi:hypothetical protein